MPTQRLPLLLLALALTALTACASADVADDDAGGVDATTADVEADADDSTPDVAPDATDDVRPEPDGDTAGIAVADGVWLMETLELLSPPDPAIILNALIGPNLEEGSLIFLFRLYDFGSPTSPTTFKIHVDAGKELGPDLYTFADEANGAPAPAQIDALGEFTTTASAERITFPVTAGLGEEARTLVYLPVESVGVTGRLTAEGRIEGGSFAGVITQAAAMDVDVPVGDNTLKLSTVLGPKDVDLDRDGTLDAWTVVARFTARRVDGQFP